MQDKKITRAKIVLEALRRYYGFKTFTQLAFFLGVKQNTLSSWISRDSLDEDLIYRKCKGLRYEWIQTAEGEMWAGYPGGVREPILIIDQPEISINPEVSDKIRLLLAQMSEEQQRDVLKYAEEKKLLAELMEERKKKKAR